MHINKDILMVGLGLLLICLGAMVSIDLPWKDGGIPYHRTKPCRTGCRVCAGT